VVAVSISDCKCAHYSAGHSLVEYSKYVLHSVLNMYTAIMTGGWKLTNCAW
jgi:hypothetical protein